jgi:hypothetical protein
VFQDFGVATIAATSLNIGLRLRPFHYSASQPVTTLVMESESPMSDSEKVREMLNQLSRGSQTCLLLNLSSDSIEAFSQTAATRWKPTQADTHFTQTSHYRSFEQEGKSTHCFAIKEPWFWNVKGKRFTLRGFRHSRLSKVNEHEKTSPSILLGTLTLFWFVPVSGLQIGITISCCETIQTFYTCWNCTKVVRRLAKHCLIQDSQCHPRCTLTWKLNFTIQLATYKSFHVNRKTKEIGVCIWRV